MHIVRHALDPVDAGLKRVPLRADRLTLAKTRWRGKAEDGVEFGFDLHHPLRHGQFFFFEDGRGYAIEQNPEPVLEIATGAQSAPLAALAWSIGNLHQPLQVLPDRLRACDDTAVRALLAQLNIKFHLAEAVFEPLRSAGGHPHPH